MCFGVEGLGRVDFGDKGSLDQGETPFNLEQPHQTYNISVTGITVGNKNTDVDFTAIFDSGTSFTYLNDPAYEVITENFNSQAQELRIQPMVQVPFEYCFGLRENQTSFEILGVNLIMKGGNQFYLFDPIISLSFQGTLFDGSTAYCLAVVKSGDVNIIGQNFMTGYRVVFDREKMVLGWTPSDLYWQKRPEKMEMVPLGRLQLLHHQHLRETMFEPYTQPLAEIQSKAAQSRPLQSGPSLDPEHSWSLVHQAALF
ncbi:hypothetical protein P3S67_013192 [Capsicum chacoense]